MYPEDLKYTKEHEWAKPDGDKFLVGITHYAQDKLGDVVFAELPQAGKELKQGEIFGVVESVKTISNLYAPLNGKVVAVNQAAIDQPAVLNKDPYGEGWLIKIAPTPASGWDQLLAAADYRKLVEGH